MEGNREAGATGETNPFTARRTEFCGACTAETRHVATIRIVGEERGSPPGRGPPAVLCLEVHRVRRDDQAMGRQPLALDCHFLAMYFQFAIE